LNGKHTIFGEVVSGQDVADKISEVPRNGDDKPDTPVKIVRIVVRTVRASPSGTPATGASTTAKKP
jgi:peptidyl-prolyl cis-trans isomerase A (cyclophilin A)